ncbi:MAG: hypothetical protein Q8941_23010 [Bacteroidota bacterium]|nr:hypothetical protein [Bacteroidota bacterium]
MEMKSYQLYNGHVDLVMSSGTILRLWLNEWSAKIVFRYKINTVSDVEHPGIVLGYDQAGVWYYMHNHFEHGRPVIEAQEGFSKGKQLFIANRQSQYQRSVILQRGLEEVLQARPYNWLNYNCQIFVNRVCHNESKSEAVENWTGGLALGALLFLGIKAFNNSK